MVLPAIPSSPIGIAHHSSDIFHKTWFLDSHKHFGRLKQGRQVESGSYTVKGEWNTDEEQVECNGPGD